MQSCVRVQYARMCVHTLVTMCIEQVDECRPVYSESNGVVAGTSHYIVDVVGGSMPIQTLKL